MISAVSARSATEWYMNSRYSTAHEQAMTGNITFSSAGCVTKQKRKNAFWQAVLWIKELLIIRSVREICKIKPFTREQPVGAYPKYSLTFCSVLAMLRIISEYAISGAIQLRSERNAKAFHAAAEDGRKRYLLLLLS